MLQFLRQTWRQLNYRSTRAALGLSLLIISIFVVCTVYLARYQVITEYKAIAAKLALRAVHRTDLIRERTFTAFHKLQAQGDIDPCSRRSQAVMRSLAYESNNLVVDIGFVREGRLLCSAFGHYGDDGIPVGEPDYHSTSGSQLRLGVRLPFAPDKLLVLSSVGGYTAIMHTNWAWSEDVLSWVPDAEAAQASIGTFHFASQKLLFSYGPVSAALQRELNAAALALGGSPASETFDDGQRIIMLERSAFGYVGFASIPTHVLQNQWRSRALGMLPIGLLLAVALSSVAFWAVRRQTSMPMMIRSALRNHEFHMVYQPVVELETGRWVGLEALVRWRKPDGTNVRPDIFIPVAEQYGLIRAMTARIVQLVAQDTGRLLASYPHIHVAINVTSDDLQDAGFQCALATVLTRYGIASTQVIIEITERLFMDTDRAREQVQELREQGLQIAIDDFGTGYSSLSYLTQLNLDFLKIDKSFVDTIGTGAVTESVVEHIIGMARSLHLAMIAEGVETQEQADYLRTRGVQLAQGWLFARPMPIDEVLERMSLTSSSV